MCGYRIFGIKHHILQDFSDNKETGVILSMLKRMQAFNIAVFVVRYKSGPNIGGVRFQIIQELAKAAVKMIPESIKYGEDFQYDNRVLIQALQHVTSAQR